MPVLSLLYPFIQQNQLIETTFILVFHPAGNAPHHLTQADIPISFDTEITC